MHTFEYPALIKCLAPTIPALQEKKNFIHKYERITRMSMGRNEKMIEQ